MATNARKRYLHIDENAGSEQIYAFLDDVENDDKDGTDNLLNDFVTKFIAEKEIMQAASTQNTSLTSCSTKWRSVKEERKEQIRRIMEVDQKSESYQATRVSPHAKNTIQAKWNSLTNRNIFFVEKLRRAATIDSWTTKPLCSSEWKKLHSYQG